MCWLVFEGEKNCRYVVMIFSGSILERSGLTVLHSEVDQRHCNYNLLLSEVGISSI